MDKTEARLRLRVLAKAYGDQATVDGHPTLNRTIREAATASVPTIFHGSVAQLVSAIPS